MALPNDDLQPSPPKTPDIRASAGVAEREAGVVPGAVSYALQRELLAPLEQWLWAHEVAQVRSL